MTKIDASITYSTDCATLILYDVEIARAAGLTDPDIWMVDFAQLEAVRDGRVAIAALGGDGVYKVRITDGNLTQDERDYAVRCLKPLGLKVESGRIDVSGYSFDERCERCVDVPRGSYSVALYEISYWQSPRWWREDQRTPDNAPADYVAVLTPYDGPLTIPDELRLDHLIDWKSGPTNYLFDSSTRVIGPRIGMELVSTVRKSGNGFLLKECGPGDYRATLTNYDGLSRKDQVRFRVVSVNHDEETIQGELIAKL